MGENMRVIIKAKIARRAMDGCLAISAIAVLTFMLGQPFVSSVLSQGAYMPPTFPPIFTGGDVTNSVALLGDVQTAYSSVTALLTQHDKDLYAPAGAVATLRGNLGNLTAVVNGMTKGLITVPLNTCTAIPPAVLNLNQVAQPTMVHGNFGGWKMMWISNPTQEVVSCPVMVSTQGYYYVLGAFIAPTAGHTMHVEVPAGVNVSGEIAAPNTGSWTSPFATAQSPLPVPLPAGASTLIVNFESGGFDFGGLALLQQ
jgi:hypothetical protein